MSLENSLERIAIALETLAGKEQAPEAPAQAKGKKPAAGKAKPAEKEAPKGPSLQDVRKALTALQMAENASTARALLGNYGATTLSKLKEEVYPQLIAAAESATKEAKNAEG